MTGVNPGRHGIFDFSRRESGSYRIRFVNATFRKAPTVWGLLSSAGKRVAVLGVPGTYPPEPVNGCMLSGFDTPVTVAADDSFAYPAALATEVRRCGGFPFADFQEFDVGPGWHERAVNALLAGLDKKERLLDTLLAREDWDCVMLLLGESDTASHHFWAFHDPASPRFDARGHGLLGDPIRTVYAAIDSLLGRVLERVPSGQVLIASDHGFGGAGDTAVFVNRWLADQGLLAWKARTAAARVAHLARGAAVRVVPERWQARLFRLRDNRLASAVESAARFGGIDWSHTRAFSEELNYFPSVWLNVEGREPEGTVSRDDYEDVRAELAAGLREWRDPERGTPVVHAVRYREDVYSGPHVAMAPDLILELSMPEGYSYVCLPSRATSGPPVQRLTGEDLRGGKLRGMSGSHRSDGLFILGGEGITPVRFAGASICDMAPTILTLCGVAVPAGWDGRVLPVVEHASAASRPANPHAVCEEAFYPAAEEERLQQKLRRLGYLE